MPDLLERIYCSEQIHIPPTFPYIMKLYCKAAIRTQPYDLLKWSAAYFRALANGEEPPTKERVEYPPYDTPSGLTPGFIKILINQFGKDPETTVTPRTLFKKWSDICLQELLLIKLIALLGATTAINWVRFVGVCAGFISQSLTQTMILICELFTEEPEGGMATIPYNLFIDLYIFLAEMECGPLTDEELEEYESTTYEEDVCEVAEKIKQGIYAGEAEGEMEYGEGEKEEEMVQGEMTDEREKRVEEEEEEDTSRKDSETNKAGEGGADDKGDEASEDKKEDKLDDDENYDDYSYQASETSTAKETESGATVAVDGSEGRSEEAEAESVKETAKPEEKSTGEKTEGEKEAAKPKVKKINLEDLEESIRAKIEERLAEEKEDYDEEQEREFEELNSYLLGAAARVQKYTAEYLGYKIFKKYLRQDVPGIGPRVDTEQVEKVVDFMDFWSNKQEQMVMPRNIRHWMCPPLDKIPVPAP